MGCYLSVTRCCPQASVSQMFCPPSCLYALYTLVHVYRHVATLLICVKYAESSILLNHRVLVRAAGGSGERGEGRTCLRKRAERQWRGAHSEWGLCEAAAAAAGQLDRWLPTGCAKNKGRRARTWDTKPGHAEIIRPTQWVANKQRELLILHNVICKTHF